MKLEDLLEQSTQTQKQTPPVTQPITQLRESVVQDETKSEKSFEFPDYLLNDPEVVGYPDLEMQKSIYTWVAEGLPFDSYSLKDLGAGRGDFYRHLDALGKAKYVDYHGIDSNPNLVNVGRTKHEGIKLINNDYIDVSLQTDYTVLIGTLNEDNSQDKWERFKSTLDYCKHSTRLASIFVLASDMEGYDGFCDYPISGVVKIIGSDCKFIIDYSEFKDIYKLTVIYGSF